MNNYIGPSVQDIPDFTEPVLAARVWEVSGERLCAWAHKEYVWSPSKQTAECMGVYARFDARQKRVVYETHYGRSFGTCHCGFYAVKDPAKIPSAFGGLRGVVALSGHVVEGTKGWRATQAEIVCFVTKSPIKRFRFRNLARDFNVPFKFSWPKLTKGLTDGHR